MQAVAVAVAGRNSQMYTSRYQNLDLDPAEPQFPKKIQTLIVHLQAPVTKV